MRLARLRSLLQRTWHAALARPHLVALGALLVAVLAGSDAFARAGGGEHYTPSRSSGGGGSRSYHGSGGSSSGGGDIKDLFVLIELISRLFAFTFAHPKVMIPVWIVFWVVVVALFRSAPSYTTSSGIEELERARVRPEQELSRSLLVLQKRDPAFDPQAFQGRAQKIFLDVQEAWFLRGLERVRHLMSDATFRRFVVLQELMRKEGRRDAIADVRVRRVSLVDVGASEAFDFLSVRVDASIRDTDVRADLSDDEARRKALGTPMEDFTEVWTFVRRLGATSRAGFDLAQGNCPNCGAPFTGGAANKCEYCGAIVNSGNYDWVLSEITQPSEYMSHRRQSEGLAALRARDPDASPELLEDRALLLFWKWLEAHAFGDPKRMQKLARPELLDELRQRIDGEWTLKLPAVGGADVTAVELDVGGFDRVHVDVRWSAVFARSDRGGSTRPRRHVVVMARKSGARTDSGVGLSTERCGNCSAPLTNSDSTVCDYCGHDLASATKEWQLVSVEPYESWRRPRTPERVRALEVADPMGAAPMAALGALSGQTQQDDPPPLPSFALQSERRRMLGVMVAIARADGVVDRSEERLLRSFSNRWQVPWSEVRQLLVEDGADPLAELRPADAQKAEEFLRTLVQAARVDGRIDRRERLLLERAAQHLQAGPEVLDRLLREAPLQ